MNIKWIAGAAAALALAGGTGAAVAATSTTQVTVNGGALELSTPNFQSASVTLNGDNQTVAATPATPWEAVDARGTGAAWSVTAVASDLVSTKTLETDRTIASSNLAFTTNAVTAGTGSDPSSGITGSTGAAFTAAGTTAVTVLNATAPHRGSYTFTPSLGITVPANAPASHSGTGSTPYTATLTVTIS